MYLGCWLVVCWVGGVCCRGNGGGGCVMGILCVGFYVGWRGRLWVGNIILFFGVFCAFSVFIVVVGLGGWLSWLVGFSGLGLWPVCFRYEVLVYFCFIIVSGCVTCWGWVGCGVKFVLVWFMCFVWGRLGFVGSLYAVGVVGCF